MLFEDFFEGGGQSYSFYKVIRSSVFGLALLPTHRPDRGKRCIVGPLEVFTFERYVHFSACAHYTKRSKHDRARKRSEMEMLRASTDCGEKSTVLSRQHSCSLC